MRSLLLNYLLIWAPLGYILVFVGMMVEGDVVLFTVAFLTQQGFFDWRLALPVVLAGLVLGDWTWYWLGHRFRRPAWLLHYVERLARPLDGHLLSNPLRTMFISKFAYGMGHITSLRVGALGMPPSRFIKINSLVSVPWFFLVSGLGFASGASFLLLQKYFRFAEIAILIGVAALVGFQHLVRYRLNREKAGG